MYVTLNISLNLRQEIFVDMGFIMSQTVLNKCKYSDRNKEGELEVTEKVFQREKYMD